MNPRLLLLKNSNVNCTFRGIWFRHCYSTDPTATKNEFDITSVDLEPKYVEDLPESHAVEALKKRNKSRLLGQHRNQLLGLKPYNQSMDWFHGTIRYKSRMLGRYGIDALDVPAGALWPTKEEIDDKIEHEKALYAHTIQESWEMIAEKHKKEAEEIRRREEELDVKLSKVVQWEKEFKARIAKKEADLIATKERKERLIEEVRRHFGFKIDPRDERFKEVLAQKEKDDKKRKKEARKEARAARYMAKLFEQPKPKTDDDDKSKTVATTEMSTAPTAPITPTKND